MTYRYIVDLVDEGMIRKGRALDLGCGPGGASTLLSSLDFEVEAVDIHDHEVMAANGGGKVTFTKADIRDFDIKNNSYDFIHARHVLHFLSKNEIRTTVARMYAGLKKGGVMYFTLSGDKDGWYAKSKNVTFLTERDLIRYVESELKASMPIHNKVTRLGFGTTTSGVRKFTHTIAYTVVK